MNIEKQVVSLKLAKELKEAGYLQEGVWWWTGFRELCLRGNSTFFYSFTVDNSSMYSLDVKDLIVAPTVAELGGAIKRHPQPEYCVDKKHWLWFATNSNYNIATKTEANARAKMWLYLKKEKLI